MQNVKVPLKKKILIKILNDKQNKRIKSKHSQRKSHTHVFTQQRRTKNTNAHYTLKKSNSADQKKEEKQYYHFIYFAKNEREEENEENGVRKHAMEKQTYKQWRMQLIR